MTSSDSGVIASVPGSPRNSSVLPSHSGADIAPTDRQPIAATSGEIGTESGAPVVCAHAAGHRNRANATADEARAPLIVLRKTRMGFSFAGSMLGFVVTNNARGVT